MINTGNTYLLTNVVFVSNLVSDMIVVISSRNGEKAVREAIRVLKSGGGVLDAVEEGVKLVEDDPADQTVGYGGLPNLLGEVELDASIMDGATLRIGAVAGIKHFKNPISISRRVMEQTPHVLLIGEGADKFAKLQGFQETNLLTPEAKKRYEEMMTGKAPLYSEAYRKIHSELLLWYRKYIESKKDSHGTLNLIVKDSKGNLAVGVSTSGTALKMPGRTGDSPIIGAGNYADNTAGAAACTGRGELSIRICLAKHVVDLMRQRVRVQDACIDGIKKIIQLNDPLGGGMNVLAMDRNGETAGASTASEIFYFYQDDKLLEPIKKPSLQVKI
jgi:beta-aspartyl-peptidase (threonine type)